MGQRGRGAQWGAIAQSQFFYLADPGEWQGEQRSNIRATALEYAEDSDFVDNDDWIVHYPESLTRWLASVMKALDFHKLPHEILENERRYPGLLDDVLTTLGYRDHIKRGD